MRQDVVVDLSGQRAKSVLRVVARERKSTCASRASEAIVFHACACFEGLAPLVSRDVGNHIGYSGVRWTVAV
jgi:hypothetical protein